MKFNKIFALFVIAFSITTIKAHMNPTSASIVASGVGVGSFYLLKNTELGNKFIKTVKENSDYVWAAAIPAAITYYKLRGIPLKEVVNTPAQFISYGLQKGLFICAALNGDTIRKFH